MTFFRRARRQNGAGKRFQIHVGCGEQALPGWINIDSQRLPGVDRVLDVRKGLPFENVDAIFGEHFLEHLTLDEGMAFLRESRRALGPEGVLRVSTPNLDWVYLTHYRVDRWIEKEDPIRDCLLVNRAFRGWGHQFLYNAQMLEAALRFGGFRVVRFCRYGESDAPSLRNLERHEKDGDALEVPSVLIAEATEQAKSTPLPFELLEYRKALRSR